MDIFPENSALFVLKGVFYNQEHVIMAQVWYIITKVVPITMPKGSFDNYVDQN